MKSINRNVMLFLQLLPAIGLGLHQIWSEFFILQQDSAPTHGRLRQSTFSPMTLPDVERCQNSFKTDSTVNL